jgi:hypothetical protein
MNSFLIETPTNGMRRCYGRLSVNLPARAREEVVSASKLSAAAPLSSRLFAVAPLIA